MNKDQVMVGALIIITAFIYYGFQSAQQEKTIGPIRQSIIANNRPLVLHFYADWCGPCKQFEPVLRNTIGAYGNTIDCQDLNIDQAKNRKLMGDFGVTAIPTTIIFDRKGNLILKRTGGMEAEELDKYLRRAVSYISK